uniref:Uncharacterized protein n=1 Tax=Tanacetum cinerariifolium TaxID=118510 RepID=A0A6L2J716_TANCI|nr:hypothetical protein [Tanacetum cinerariifolium]
MPAIPKNNTVTGSVPGQMEFRGILGDKIICDLDKTPDLSQRSPQNCPTCGHPVNGHYCQGCAFLRKKFKEDLFASGIEHGILQDSSEPSNDNSNGVNALREPFVVNQDPVKIPHKVLHNQSSLLLRLWNDARYGHYCTPQVPFVYPKPCYNQDLNFPQEFQDFHNFQQQDFCCENCGNEEEKKIIEEQQAKARYSKILACYDDDDDCAFAITPNEPVNSLSMRDKHLDTIPATESDEFIKSSVKNLVPIPSESKGEHECDVLAREEFTTFSNILFDFDCDFYSSDDQSFYDEDEIDLSFTLDYPMPPGIEDDDYDSERDILISEDLLRNDTLSLPEIE